MSRHVCTVCGGRRIPIPGLNIRVHPLCLPDSVVLWTAAEQRAWLAQRAERNHPVPATQSRQDATEGPNP